MRLKRNSPCDARATPDEIMKTMMANLRLGSWIRKVHEIRRMATGVNAYGKCSIIRTLKAAEEEKGYLPLAFEYRQH
jgi:hypothetical protein